MMTKKSYFYEKSLEFLMSNQNFTTEHAEIVKIQCFSRVLVQNFSISRFFCFLLVWYLNK